MLLLKILKLDRGDERAVVAGCTVIFGRGCDGKLLELSQFLGRFQNVLALVNLQAASRRSLPRRLYSCVLTCSVELGAAVIAFLPADQLLRLRFIIGKTLRRIQSLPPWRNW